MATGNGHESKPPAFPFDASVYGATVQLPAFDKVEPETWFTVADANFALRKVTDSTTKYYYVLSKLDAASLRKLSAFLKVPRSADPYQDLRRKLCRTYEPSLEQKLDTLLATKEMGDERPIEFALELQRLAANATGEDYLKRIFVRSLPPSIATAISKTRSSTFDELAEAADDAWMTAAANAAEAASVSAISGSQATGPRRGGRGGHQRGRTTGQIKTLALCHYHLKFGETAKKCSPGCTRWTGNRPSDTARVCQVEEDLDGEDSQVGLSEN